MAKSAELWLDGGHNPAAGRAIVQTLNDLPDRPLYLICGMLNTKDVREYLSCFKGSAEHLTALSIPGEAATLTAQDTMQAAHDVGLKSDMAGSIEDALAAIISMAPHARILICGSLYLAGHVIRTNRII